MAKEVELTTNFDDILHDAEIKIVVELMGGLHPAKGYISDALNAGKNVVTANKDLMATFGSELIALAAKNKIDVDAVYIISRLKDLGFQAYIVGGAVRDLIVGAEPKDFDIVTNATPSRIKKLFRNSRIIGKRFRIVHVIFGNKIFEVSTFRSNAVSSVGNDFGTMDEDVLRRDFTLNALYYDPILEQVIDYVDGMRDIKKHIIRPVIPLETIFIDDPVRMLRAIKYAAKTDSKMSFLLRHKIRHSASLLNQISPLENLSSVSFFQSVKLSIKSEIKKTSFFPSRASGSFFTNSSRSCIFFI